MGGYIKTYLVALVIFLVIDFLWLGLVAKNMYRDKLGFLLKENYNMIAALTFYMVYIVGLVYFVISKAVSTGSWQYALFAGIFFGVITYATYDMTNLATVKDWPISITVIDIIWGGTLNGITSLLSYYIATNFNFLA
ncbi:MAG: DUF2177 family protein [Bacillota bacterium]